MEEKILVLDFGGQYNQLIARRVREHHVYAQIKPYNKITPQEIQAAGYQGIIFTGGPNSVYDERSPHYDPAILNLGIPILGICYGAQLMAYMAGGVVSGAESSSEYGKTESAATLVIHEPTGFDHISLAASPTTSIRGAISAFIKCSSNGNSASRSLYFCRSGPIQKLKRRHRSASVSLR